MAKIATTRLPDSTPEYEPSQFDALIRVLEQITQQLNFGFQQDQLKNGGREYED